MDVPDLWGTASDTDVAIQEAGSVVEPNEDDAESFLRYNEELSVPRSPRHNLSL